MVETEFARAERLWRDKCDLLEQLAQQKAMLDEAIRVIEFYGLVQSWSGKAQTTNVCRNRICDSDIEGVETLSGIRRNLKKSPYGGKRAREFLEKVKK